MSDNQLPPVERSIFAGDLNARITAVAERAQRTFWASVALAFPEITTGDFPPDAAFSFDAACEKAVRIWLSGNVEGRGCEHE